MSRISITPNRFNILYNEVYGYCPICHEPLKSKDGIKHGEAAHIYPHRPSKEEEEMLLNAPRLSSNPEDIRNLILLCPTCHDKFDKPRTLEGYMHLYKLKKQILQDHEARSKYCKSNIEDEINIVLEFLSKTKTIDRLPLSYNALEVDKKLGDDVSCIFGFRTLVGLYSRIWGNDNNQVNRPLYLYRTQNKDQAILNLIKLFSYDQEISALESDIEYLSKKNMAYNSAISTGIIARKITKTEYNSNIDKIKEIDLELSNLSSDFYKSLEENIFEIYDKDDQSEYMKANLTKLRREKKRELNRIS